MRKLLAIPALAVLAGAGALTAAAITNVSESVSTCQTARAELLQANRIVAPSQSYRKDNPVEYAKVRAYLDGGARPTGVTSHMGLGLVALEDTCRDFTTTTTSTTTTTTTTTTPPPPATGNANLWVDLNGGTCMRQSPPVAYSDAAACATFDQAWDAAQSGDTIRVRAGSYPRQVVTGDKSSVTKIIGEGTVIVGGPSADCVPEFGSFSRFCTQGRYLWLENVTIESGTTANVAASTKVYAANVTFVNVRLHGDYPALYVQAPDFTWDGGTHGETGRIGPPITCSISTGEPVWIDSSADRAKIKDIRFNVKRIQVGAGQYCGADNTPHLENIRLQGDVDDVVIEGNTFVAGTDAGSGHIFVSGSSADRARLDDNIFEPVNGTYAMQSGTNQSWTIRRNRFDQGVTGSFPGLTACGNTGLVSSSWTVSC